MDDGTGLGGSDVAVEEAKERVERWLRGGVSLANRQDVAVALLEEVKRLEAERP